MTTLDSYWRATDEPGAVHKAFNQHLWVALEDYLLDSAETEGFRACVFTGPVFKEDDSLYREARLPTAYWKVAVMKKESGRALSTTAYMVSQQDLITDLEFVFGECRTYQVPVAMVEKVTGLEFDQRLRASDPLAHQEDVAIRPLDGFDQVRI